MDVERLREFLVFTQKMNFTTAAAELHMAQPNLSKHIRALENEVGTTLVIRGGLGTPNALTPAGVRFREFADDMVSAYEQLVDDCHEIAGQDPPVRIQDVRHVINVIPQLRAMVNDDYLLGSGFSYVRIDGVTRDALELGAVDFILTLEPTPHWSGANDPFSDNAYAIIALQPEEMVAMVSSVSPYYTASSLSLADVAELQLMGGNTPFFADVRESIAQIFATVNCPVSFHVVSDRALDGDAYPMKPEDLNVCTRRFARYYQDLDVEDVHELEIEDFTPVLYPYLICKRDNPSHVVQKLIQMLAQ